MDKTLQITFYKSETNWIKILEFTKWEIIWFFIPKILFNSELLENPYFRNRITNSWIYFLSWDEIYIWQALNLFERLKWHIREWKKEFKDILCFTTTNNSFDEWDINYLEKSIIALAKEKWEFNLMNLNSWNNTNIKEYRKSDLNSYIEEIKFLLNILWYRFLERLKENNETSENIYFIEKKWVKAKMLINKNWYIVFSWSYWINKQKENKSFFLHYWRIKNELLDKWIIEIKGDKIVFLKDYVFPSSSTPASILLWNSVSWPKTWKNKKQQTLQEIEISNLKDN